MSPWDLALRQCFNGWSDGNPAAERSQVEELCHSEGDAIASSVAILDNDGKLTLSLRESHSRLTAFEVPQS